MRRFLILTAVFFSLAGIVFAILPLGTIGLIPVILGLVFAVLTYFKSTPGRKKILPKILIGLTLLLSVVIIGKETLIEDTVAVDASFEEKIEESNEENIQELENELEELDLEDFNTEDLNLEDDPGLIEELDSLQQ